MRRVNKNANKIFLLNGRMSFLHAKVLSNETVNHILSDCSRNKNTHVVIYSPGMWCVLFMADGSRRSDQSPMPKPLQSSPLIMTRIRRLLFCYALLTCRTAAQSDGLDDSALIKRSRKLLRHERDASADGRSLEQLFQADIGLVIDGQQIQSIDSRRDAHAAITPSRLLQTQSWRTNNNYNRNRNSGINSDGTTRENYWKDRINRGLRNVGIVIVVWFVVIGFIGGVCRCYLCWESILSNSFRYNSNFDEDGNHLEASDERSDGVDMPPISPLNGHHV